MVTCLKSCALVGIDGRIVDVEVDVSSGMFSFDIVGLADTAVKESPGTGSFSLKKRRY